MIDYLFASEAEKDRLQLQARVWEPHTETLLEAIGIRPNWHCADLGCGAMGILGPLSRRVPQGKVIGIDVDKTLLSAAQVYIHGEGLQNVELRQGDIHCSGLQPGSFDLVHERFVLPHAREPERLLQDMIDLAKPGGIIALQEPDDSSYRFYPPRRSWLRVLEVIDGGVALQGDINIGRRTYQLMRSNGLRDVNIRAAVLALHEGHPYMRMPIVAVKAMRDRIIAAGISTSNELDALLADVEVFASDPETFQITFTVTQVWGRTPS